LLSRAIYETIRKKKHLEPGQMKIRRMRLQLTRHSTGLHTQCPMKIYRAWHIFLLNSALRGTAARNGKILSESIVLSDQQLFMYGSIKETAIWKMQCAQRKEGRSGTEGVKLRFVSMVIRVSILQHEMSWSHEYYPTQQEAGCVCEWVLCLRSIAHLQTSFKMGITADRLLWGWSSWMMYVLSHPAPLRVNLIYPLPLLLLLMR